MARVLLTTVYDQYAVGLRIMAACLLRAGHDVRLLFLETEKRLSREWAPGTRIPPHKYMVIGNDGGIAVFDGTASPISEACWSWYAEEIRRFSPRLIGFGVRSYFDDQAPGFLRRLRRIAPEALLVCGGFGPTFHPSAYLEEADLVVRGEGEETVVDLADALDRGTAWEGIPNTCTRGNGTIQANPLRAPTRDLDSLPFPLYGKHTVLVQDTGVSTNDETLRNYVTLAGRGCLGTCTYCAGGNWPTLYTRHGHTLPKRRARSLRKVLDELQAAARRGYRSVSLADEHLAAPVPAFLEFFRDYKREVALPLGAYLHTGVIVKHPEIVRAAVDAGLVFSCVGLQSGSERFSREVYRRRNDNEEILRAARLLKSHGVTLQYHVILGNPLEDRSDVDQTFELVRRLPALQPKDVLGVFRFTPLPGAPILKRFASPEEARTPDDVFVRDGLLCQLRRYVDDRYFEACRRSVLFERHPLALQGVLRYFVDRASKTRSRESLQELTGKKVAVWGTGGRWRDHVAPLIHRHPGTIAIDCFVDSDPRKQGTRMAGKPVLAPPSLAGRTVDAILIATCFEEEVAGTLIRLGLNATPRLAL